jgi:hypothetical protein
MLEAHPSVLKTLHLARFQALTFDTYIVFAEDGDEAKEVQGKLDAS